MIFLLPTNRNLLKLSASIFDPLGLISAVTVQFRILLQDFCKLHSGWDTASCKDMVWLIEDLKDVRVISIPRYYFSEVIDEAESYSLNVFGDASEKAFPTIIYVVMKAHPAYHPRLIASKSRVVLIKSLAIPCMELLSALISARLLNTVRQALENQVSFELIYCWSDSIAQLSYTGERMIGVMNNLSRIDQGQFLN